MKALHIAVWRSYAARVAHDPNLCASMFFLGIAGGLAIAAIIIVGGAT